MFPVAATVVLNDFYVDDLLTGADSLEELRNKKRQIEELLEKGGFPMSKWVTNNGELQGELPNEEVQEIDLAKDFIAGVLGMIWFPSDDCLCFKFNATDDGPLKSNTKRAVLSKIAQIYDPLGLAAPFIVTAKAFIQKLWMAGLGWDAPLAVEQQDEWQKIYQQIAMLKNYKVERWIGMEHECQMQLHGFADASKLAYAAVVYARITDMKGHVTCKLIASKTRVTSKKKQLTIPKLELLAAQLTAKLVNRIKQALQCDDVKAFYYSDSTVTIFWLRRNVAHRRPFVANRVECTNKLTGNAEWAHVKGNENPADLASRGTTTKVMMESSLWQNGPNWLSQPEAKGWPKPTDLWDLTVKEWEQFKAESKPFVGTLVLHTQRTLSTELPGFPNRMVLILGHATFESILRITAFVFRFARNARPMKRVLGSSLIDPHLRRNKIPPITREERYEALVYWIRKTQLMAYRDKISKLKKGISIARDSDIKSLSPFLCKETGCLRVGGRIGSSLLEYDAKHPFIVPRKSPLAELLIRAAHFRTMHGSIQQMMVYLQQQVWIPRLRAEVRIFNNRCAICLRQRQKDAQQMMTELPSARTRPAHPFERCGVDFAGPIELKTWENGKQKIKGYIVVFVCMTTKAIHLELAFGLSTEAFLDVFKRFAARRGMPREVWSDNGTNFVGTKTEFGRIMDEWGRRLPEDELAAFGIAWHFITPAAPHQGGLWEAGVKAVKTHLRKIAGARLFSPFSMYTMLTQIEACLNSRPLTPVSEDPDDFSVLTPAHFLIGRPLIQPLSSDVRLVQIIG